MGLLLTLTQHENYTLNPVPQFAIAVCIALAYSMRNGLKQADLMTVNINKSQEQTWPLQF